MPFGLPVAPPVAPAPKAAAGWAWQTLLDLDFAAQATQVFAADGAYTIDGKNWTKVNSASEGTKTNILNGTGLQFPDPHQAFNVGYVSNPYLWLPLSAILGSVVADWSTAVRIYVSMGAETFAAGHTPNGLYVGICDYSGGTAVENGIFLFRGQPTGGTVCHTIVWGDHGGMAPQSATSDPTIVPGAGNRTFCFDMPHVGAECVAPQCYHAPDLAVGAAFPALSTFKPDVGAGNSLQNGQLGSAAATFAQMGLFIGGSGQGNPGGYSGVVQRVRVDVRT